MKVHPLARLRPLSGDAEGQEQLQPVSREEDPMDNFSFGLTLTVIGMGSTLVSLWFLTLVINLLKRLFPYREEEDGKEAP